MIIAIDFDGTICENDYPRIGSLRDGAKEVIQRLHYEGHYIIIWTCRSTTEDLLNMVNFLMENKIPFDRINDNHPDKITLFGNNSRKIYADIYIDDKSIGDIPVWHNIYENFNPQSHLSAK